MKSIFFYSIFFIFYGFIWCFNCPILRESWYTLKTVTKCYAIRSLELYERDYKTVERICQNELDNGHIVDLEYENLDEFKVKLINFIKNNRNITRNIVYNGSLVPGFFIGYRTKTNQGIIEYLWLSGRPLNNLQTPKENQESSEQLHIIVNDNP